MSHSPLTTIVVSSVSLLASCVPLGVPGCGMHSSAPVDLHSSDDDPQISMSAARSRSTAVSPELRSALDEALDDERHAIAFYEAVMGRYGRRRPFANIVNAERRHADALLAQYQRLGLDVPADRWADTTIEVPASFRAACAASADAEVRNVAIYDRLLAVARDPDLGDPAVLNVFERLRWASQERHLPAFKRCSGR